ncbi:apolipoprotein N-acyltransferase [Brackiella oedipodis]|uniref:apolipoprotein N-acyltransferase n=1 Tax=Brackiella oedipodis TaxID=124225 RepID=UPI0004904221|nr:apolipoprotein N-acyltransferase [Brackiella oedipodis]
MKKLLNPNSVLLPIALGVVHSLSFFAGYIPDGVATIIQWLTFSGLTLLVFTSRRGKALLLEVTLFGTASFSIGLYWLYTSMHTYGGLPSVLAVLVVLLFGFYLSLYLTAAAAIFHKLKKRSLTHSPQQAFYLLPLLWASLVTLSELARGYFFTGFPWNGIAYAYVDSPLSALAPIGGAYSITFVAVFCAGTTALFILANNKKRNLHLPATLALVLMACMALKVIPWASPIGKPLSVRLVQGNVDQALKFRLDTGIQTVLDQLYLAAKAPTNPQNPPKLVIFPETILPVFQNQLNPRVWQTILQSSAETNATYLLGAPLATGSANSRTRLTNSILMINRNTSLTNIYEGNNLNRYEKRHLVPFGEFIPFGFRWFVELMNIPLGDFNRGHMNQNNFMIDDQVLAPNICYEDIFGEELIDALYSRGNNHPGATIMFNVSNLAWFGDSIALYQQLQQSRMRTLEAARPMLRATNTGITAYINANGRIVAQLPAASAGVLDVQVQGMTGNTWYSRIGNIPILLLCAVFVILFWFLRANSHFHIPDHKAS